MKIRDGRAPKRFFENRRNWGGVGKENEQTLVDFDREKAAQGAAEGTRYMYLFCVTKLAKHFNGKSFKKLSKGDLIDFFEKWKDYKSACLKVSVKAFFKWLYGGTYPEQVSWIKTHGFERRKLPSDILTQEEVKKLADACINPRDRALILLLYESGARAGEIISLDMKDLTFDEYGAVLILNGKTGMRRVRVIDSVPDLKTWLNNHPNSKDPNAALFPELRGKFNRLAHHGALGHILKTAKMRCGLQKRIHAHIFRHSRATHLAKDFTEQELKIIFGWTGSSRMPATYVHLSGADVDKKMLEKRGMIESEAKNGNGNLKPILCANCNVENSPTARFCTQCGIAFFLKDAMQKEQEKKDAVKLFEAIMKDEELKKAIVQRLTSGKP